MINTSKAPSRPKVYLWHSNRYPQAFASWHWTSPDLNFPAIRPFHTKTEAERDAKVMLATLKWDFCYSAPPETLTDAKTSAPAPDTTERYPSAPEQSGETTDTSEPLYVWKVTQEERELMTCALTRLRDDLDKQSSQAWTPLQANGVTITGRQFNALKDAIHDDRQLAQNLLGKIA